MAELSGFHVKDAERRRIRYELKEIWEYVRSAYRYDRHYIRRDRWIEVFRRLSYYPVQVISQEMVSYVGKACSIILENSNFISYLFVFEWIYSMYRIYIKQKR